MSDAALTLAVLLTVSMLGLGLALFTMGPRDDAEESARRYRR